MNITTQTQNQKLFAKLEINVDEIPIEQLAEYTAVEYFLTTEDEPSPEADNLQKVNRYLEAFHHLREVEDWKRAHLIISEHSITPSGLELHQQLSRWGDYKNVIDMCEWLLDKVDTPQSKCALMSTLGITYDSLGKYHLAIEYHQKVLNTGQEFNNFEWKIHGLTNIGYAYVSLSKFHEAIKYHQQALAMADDNYLLESIPKNLTGLGNVYYELGNYENAIECLERSLKIAKLTNNLQNKASALHGLACCYRAKKQDVLAIQLYEESLTMIHELGNQVAEAGAYDNIGVCYKNMGNYEKAIEYQKKAIALSRKIEYKQGEATALGNLGVSYFRLKQYKEASDSQDKAIKLCRKIGDKLGEARAFNNLGNVYFSTGEPYHAWLYLMKSIWLLDSLGVDYQVKRLLNEYFHKFSELCHINQLLGVQNNKFIYETFGEQLQEISKEYGKEAVNKIVYLIATQDTH